MRKAAAAADEVDEAPDEDGEVEGHGGARDEVGDNRRQHGCEHRRRQNGRDDQGRLEAEQHGDRGGRHDGRRTGQHGEAEHQAGIETLAADDR
jgi:hypothetical protein